MQEERGPRFERWRATHRFKCSVCNYILRDLTEWTRHISQQRYPGCRNRPPQRGPNRATQRAVVQPAVIQPAVAQESIAIQPVITLPVSAPRKRKHTCDCEICGICPGEQRFTFITCGHTLCIGCVDTLFQSDLRHPEDPIRRPKCPTCRESILDIDLRRHLPEEVSQSFHKSWFLSSFVCKHKKFVAGGHPALQN